MNLINYLLTSFLLLCEVLSDNTVTEFATELVYVCPPREITTTSVVVTSSHWHRLTPSQKRRVVTNVSIFNDFETGSLMCGYSYDLNLLEHSNMTAGSGNWSASSMLQSPHKREGNSAKAYDKDEIGHMENEFKDNSDVDPGNIALRNLVRNHTLLGALSVYMDMARSVDLDDDQNIYLKRLSDIWPKIWYLYYKANDEDDDDHIYQTRYALNILMVLTPNYYSVQYQDYKTSQQMLSNAFASDDAKEKNGVIDVLGRTNPQNHLSSTEIDFLRELVDDSNDETRIKYLTFLLNVYYYYGELRSCKEADSSCRIVDGWGAIKDSYPVAATGSDISDAAAPLLSLFASSIPVTAVYASVPVAAAAGAPAAAAAVAVANVPLHPSQILDRVDEQHISYSSIHETVSSTVTASAAATACDEKTSYENEMKEISGDDSIPSYDNDFSEDEENEAKENAEDIGPLPNQADGPETKPNVGKNEEVGFDKFCDHLAGDGKERCEAVVNRHKVEIKRDDGEVHLNKRFKDIKAAEFRLYRGKDYTEPVRDVQLPVYVVNPLGDSPGVACNALKFIATNYANSAYFNAFVKNDDDEKREAGMLALIKGARYRRNQIYTETSECKKAEGDKGVFEMDEFPPNSANLLIDLGHIALTCVPQETIALMVSLLRNSTTSTRQRPTIRIRTRSTLKMLRALTLSSSKPLMLLIPLLELLWRRVRNILVVTETRSNQSQRPKFVHFWMAQIKMLRR